MSEIVINKIQSIQRCIARAREELQGAGEGFPHDYTRQDAAVLNITRACEQAIDLANYIIKTHEMGIPTSSRESFSLLERQRVIPAALSETLQKMVGFRNIAVHQYQALKIEIVMAIIERDLNDLVVYTEAILEFVRGSEP